MKTLGAHLPRPPKGRTFVAAAGKAAASMALAVEQNWPGKLEGIAVTRYQHGLPTKHIKVVEAGHPVPDQAGEAAAREILRSVAGLGPDDLLLALLSGGGSSLLSLPAPGVSMEQLKSLTGRLLKSGADIQEINTVRKHLSAIAGGRLAAASRAPVVALIISDVTGNEPTHIASGPCASDPTTIADAKAVLAKYRLEFHGPFSESPKRVEATNTVIATAYRSLEAAAEGTYRGYVIRAMSPPSSGGLTMIQMLAMLERFPIGDTAAGYGFGSLRTVNVMAEAMRLAFADRSIWMGDADFVHVPAKGLLHPQYVAGRSALINPLTRMVPNPQPGDPRPFDMAGVAPGTRLAVAEPVTGPGETTTHFSVVDQWGNMVAYTNTIESSHGIGVFAGYRNEDGSFHNHGFLLNNELTDFNTTPSINPYTGESGYNDVQPNKRPRSSMTPTMIFTPDGKPLVAFGSPGGSTIINSVLNVALNLIDHRMTLQEAIDAPRVSVTSSGSNVSLERGFPQETVDGLRSLGYTVGTSEIGSVQAVIVEPKTGKQYGGADSRREGTVIGLPRP